MCSSDLIALDRLVDVRPLDLEKLRASVAAQSARDALRDFYVEPAHPRRIPWVGLDEWRTALGIAAPQQRAMTGALRREGYSKNKRDNHCRASASPAHRAGPRGEPR